MLCFQWCCIRHLIQIQTVHKFLPLFWYFCLPWLAICVYVLYKENYFSTLILGSIFGDFIIFYRVFNLGQVASSMLVITILTFVNTTLALFSYLWLRYTGMTGFRLKSTWKTSVGQSPPRPTGVLSCQCYWHEGTVDLQQQLRVTRNINLESRT